MKRGTRGRAPALKTCPARSSDVSEDPKRIGVTVLGGTQKTYLDFLTSVGLV